MRPTGTVIFKISQSDKPRVSPKP